MKTRTPHPKSRTDSAPLAVLLTSILFVLVGIGSIAISLWFEVKETPAPKVFAKAFAELGLALISIGGIALLLEVRFMSDYFQRKIAQTMTQEEYLKKLSKDQLEGVQADSLKAYWELEDMDREGTLYDYCKNQVQGYIAKPYRENVKGTYTIESVNDETH